MLSPNYPVLWCPLPDRVALVFIQVISPPLGWSPLSSFLVIWSPSGDTRGPSVVFEAVDMAGPGPFHFSHIADYIYDFCPLPDLDVGISILVRDVEHTSFQWVQLKRRTDAFLCAEHHSNCFMCQEQKECFILVIYLTWLWRCVGVEKWQSASYIQFYLNGGFHASDTWVS